MIDTHSANQPPNKPYDCSAFDVCKTESGPYTHVVMWCIAVLWRSMGQRNDWLRVSCRLSWWWWWCHRSKLTATHSTPGGFGRPQRNSGQHGIKRLMKHRSFKSQSMKPQSQHTCANTVHWILSMHIPWLVAAHVWIEANQSRFRVCTGLVN